MRHPKRLRESSTNDVERLLLGAGRAPAPSAAKARALAAATGVIAATTLTAGNATGAAIAGKAAAGAKASALLSVKWIVVASVTTASVAAGTVAVHATLAARAMEDTHASSEAPARPHAAKAVAPAPRAASPPPPPEPEPPSEAVATEPEPLAAPPPPLAPEPAAVHTVDAPAPRRAATAPTKTAPIASTSSSAAELLLLDQARSANAAHDPARALAILGDYAARFPRGTMAPEARVLRIEALAGAGDASAAQREGDAFLRDSPTSPYAARVRSILGAPNP